MIPAIVRKQTVIGFAWFVVSLCCFVFVGGTVLAYYLDAESGIRYFLVFVSMAGIFSLKRSTQDEVPME